MPLCSPIGRPDSHPLRDVSLRSLQTILDDPKPAWVLGTLGLAVSLWLDQLDRRDGRALEHFAFVPDVQAE